MKSKRNVRVGDLVTGNAALRRDYGGELLKICGVKCRVTRVSAGCVDMVVLAGPNAGYDSSEECLVAFDHWDYWKLKEYTVNKLGNFPHKKEA